MKYIIAVYLLLFSGVITLKAQYKKIGIPFVTNFSPLEYKAGNQNWAITQDSRGIMYFGNSYGIMEFDGTTWNIVDPVNAISFAKNKNEQIFVGARGDFGYLAPDSTGKIKYFSLLNLVPEQYKNVNNFWNLACIGNKTYYPNSNGKLYVYENGLLTVFDLDGYLGCIAEYKNKIFIECSGGLYTLENNKPKDIDGGILLDNVNVRNMFDFGKDTMLIVTRENGLFIFNNNKITPWETPVTPFIKDYQVYLSTQLPNGFIAFGTVESGVIIMDKSGNPVQHINRYGGMINDDHCGIFTDKQGNIWSGLEFGISYIHVNSAWSQFNELAGLSTATFYSVVLSNGKLFAGNAQGLFSKPFKEKDNPLAESWKFVSQKGLDARKVWDIIPVQNDIIFSSSNVGTYCLNEKDFYKIIDYIAPYKFTSGHNGKYILGAGEHAGVFVFKKETGKWQSVSRNMNIGYVESFTEDSSGHIWTFENREKIIEFLLENDSLHVINTYDTTSGLPPNASVSVFKLFNRIYAGTEKGTYLFNESTRKFELNNELTDLIGHDIYILETKNDTNGTIWIWGINNENVIIGFFSTNSKKKLSFKRYDNQLNKINEFSNNTFYPVDAHNVFIGSSNYLVHFDPSAQKTPPFFNTLIRYVTLPVSNDSLIFNGAFLDKNNLLISNQDANENIEIPYSQNSIKFGFSATYYEENKRNIFSFKLEGFDADWSSWSQKTEKEYTNLHEGAYTFMVKSKNLYGDESATAVYRFIILPPWYRTIFAYISYLLIFILLIYIIVKISIRKIELEKIKLETIVLERTTEVVRQKNEISEKNKELEQQKEEILSQNEILNQQNEEIKTQRDEIESQRDMVLQQKEHIETINKEITDSINYAKQIQIALLPKPDLFKELLGEHFIIYKPKDIVSGDFYWLVKVENITLVAVADCTGHGVPGGFMSMLGMSLLKEIVVKEYITNTAIVLRRLRKEIIHALGQTGASGEHKDGMDIAICAIDYENLKLQFSGANNPLWIVRKLDNLEMNQLENEFPSPNLQIEKLTHQLVELKGDKMPIAIYERMDKFTLHEIDIQKGEQLFMFTDGIIDQFGGPRGKKFLSKNLKHLIFENSQKTMIEQKGILENTLINWIGNNEQIDDITILGIKI